MDNLTHALAGAAIAETRLGRRAGALAGPALVLGANLPDIDALAYVHGSDFALGCRRGITHGPLGLALLPLLLTAALVGWDRLRRRRERDPSRPPLRPGALLALVYLGVLTHPALDLLNTYGVRFLHPFSPRWFYGDTLFIMDPWLWLALGGGVWLARAARGVASPWHWGALALVTSALVLLGPRGVPAGAKVAWCLGLVILIAVRALGRTPRLATAGGLALGLGYIAVMLALGGAGRRLLDDELARRGEGAERTLVSPRPADPLAWDVVVETATAYRFGSLRWLRDPPLALDEATAPRPLAGDPVAAAALAAPQVRGLARWLRFPLVAATPLPDGTTLVRIGDARYGRAPGARGLGGAVVLDRALRPVTGPAPSGSP